MSPTPRDSTDPCGGDAVNPKDSSGPSEQPDNATTPKSGASKPKYEPIVNKQPQPITGLEIVSREIVQGEEMSRRILTTHSIPVHSEPEPEEYPNHTLAQKAIALPLRTPVCLCDTLCYTCDMCGAAWCTFISDDEMSVSAVVHRSESEPGSCTECVRLSFPVGACPAFNQQNTHAARHQPRVSLMCARILCTPMFPLCQLLPFVLCLPCLIVQTVCTCGK
ncbi:hypothetical protein C8R45DRAFT_198197 [Mycena sanguinolenta]|nr:hypothetical protein C8R45DRAFT_198197 [Mycena sanguinolenta]